MKAYSEDTKTEYASWDEMVEAEANGYVVVAVITRGRQTWPWVQGPYPDQAEANKARNRMRKKMKRDDPYGEHTWKIHVRPLWPDGRG